LRAWLISARGARGLNPFVRLVLGRAASGVLTVWLASVLVFAGTELLPGDAATAILGRNARGSLLADLRQKLGLDHPAPQRYWDWLTSLLQGHLGRSLLGDQTVGSIIGHRIVNSLVLAVITLAILVPLALSLGTFAATHRYRRSDHALQYVTLILNSLPEFVTGTLLALVFGITLAVLPPVSLFDPSSYGWQHPNEIVLPIATLVAAALAPTARMVRGSVIEVLDRPYVQMARLKGLSNWEVLRRHVLPNALVPTVQVIALSIGWMMGGIVVVEFVFQYPGMGEALVSAVAERDVPTLQALAVIIATVYVFVNLAADLVTVLLTPKLRTAL
jgi:peptide/nickel transport system permease protein